MIRIAILADTARAARELAEVLASDERLDVLDATAWHGASHRQADVDVLLISGVRARDLARETVPTVLLAEAQENSEPEHLPNAILPLQSTPSEIAAAIIAAAEGFYVLTPNQLDNTRRAHPPSWRETDSDQVEHLTARELEVLRMMADGLGNKEIAGALGISDHTAKFHVSQVLAKLGVRSRTEAVRTGIRRGLVAL